MIVVFVITDFSLGGSLLRFREQIPDEASARLSSANNAGIQKQEEADTEEMSEKELGEYIAEQSCEFVKAAFERDKTKVAGMLSKDTMHVVSPDKSSYIRYASEGLHVEGYMATDRNLLQVRQDWYVVEGDDTITSGVEVEIEGEDTPQIWYIHYKKSFGKWKIFMLENGV
jgi:hypothetical protein